MMPWRWTIDTVAPAKLGGFKSPLTAEAMRGMLPFFFNDMDWIGNVNVVEKIVGGIVDAVRKAEDKFDQTFGGWIPSSNQFGIAPLRPQLLGCLGPTPSPQTTGGRWVWTDSANTTIDWTAEDSYLNAHALLTDELILIYGIFNLEPVPNTLEIQIKAGDRTLPIWNLEQMRVSGKGYVIFPDPVIIEPRTTISIAAATRSGTAVVTEEMGLLGYQFTPMAKLITKRPTT